MLVAAHGTRSPAGLATTHRLVAALAALRPGVVVRVGFLDVASPSLADALADHEDVVVVPLLLSAGYHVRTDIPAIAAGRHGVRVARHIGPDPLVIAAVAERLQQARPAPGATVLLAAIGSSQQEARDEVRAAAQALGDVLGRAVAVLPLDRLDALDTEPAPLAIATYLLAEGDFLDRLRATVGTRGVVADPIGTHPALVRAVWSRYDAELDAADVG